MVVLTASGCMPELSESKYWCTSQKKWFFGSRKPSMVLALPLPIQECAPVQELPGTRIRLVAPVLADCGGGGIGRAEPLLVRHVIRLVHQPEPDMRVVFERGCQPAPKVGERGLGNVRGADYFAVVAGIVVRVQQHNLVLRRRRRDHALNASQHDRIKPRVQRRLKVYPVKRKPDDVDAFAGKIRQLRPVRVNVILAVDGFFIRQRRGKLAARDADPGKRQRLRGGGRSRRLRLREPAAGQQQGGEEDRLKFHRGILPEMRRTLDKAARPGYNKPSPIKKRMRE